MNDLINELHTLLINQTLMYSAPSASHYFPLFINTFFYSGSKLPSLMLDTTLCMCVGSVCGLYWCVACLYSGPNRDILWLRRKRTRSSNIASLVVNQATHWSADRWRQGPWKSFMSALPHFKRSELYFKIMIKGYLQHSSVCLALGIEWLSAANSLWFTPHLDQQTSTEIKGNRANELKHTKNAPNQSKK